MRKVFLAAVAMLPLAGPAMALPDDACQAEWNRADANRDGVLTAEEARPYLTSMATPPANGQITAKSFMDDCKADRIKLAGTSGSAAPSVSPGATQLGTSQPAPARPATGQTAATDAGAPLSGANSFTEEQARDRIAKAGYASVSALKKDDQGVWRGTASKDGHQVNVAVDYRGNVVTQ